MRKREVVLEREAKKAVRERKGEREAERKIVR
jgi:hypothetical protein